MANERDENLHDEEGEYQFSDEDMNYELENEEESKPAEAPPVAEKRNVLTKLTPYRRMLIGVGVFFVLIFVVFKMLTPGTTPPPTDFTQATPVKMPPTAKIPPKPAVAAVNPQTQQPQPPAITPPAQTVAPAPVPQPTPVAAPAPQTAMMPPPAPPQAQPQPMTPPPQVMQQPAPPMTPQPQVAQAPQPPSMNPYSAPSNPPPAPPASETTPDQKNISDRLASLEQENANLINTIRSQFGQKIADYDAQNKAAQERIQALNRRIAELEATLNKMTQVMRDEGLVRPVMVGPSVPPMRPAEPRMVYTVQAIIPGRAWLKSDSGETVTVAEGDLLKDYGRIIKIDPYDGIVNIDTGGRVISLSYGANND